MKEDVVSRRVKRELRNIDRTNISRITGKTFSRATSLDTLRDIHNVMRYIKGAVNREEISKDKAIQLYGLVGKSLQITERERGYHHNPDPTKEEYADYKRGVRERAISLEEGLASFLTIGVVGIIASLFFFSFNFTGNAISSLNVGDGNILGSVFFVTGLIGLALHFREKAKNKKHK